MIYCPTEQMLADLSSKPTQGSSFKKQRDLVMGLKEKDFKLCKAWHRKVLEKYELWDS